MLTSSLFKFLRASLKSTAYGIVKVFCVRGSNFSCVRLGFKFLRTRSLSLLRAASTLSLLRARSSQISCVRDQQFSCVRLRFLACEIVKSTACGFVKSTACDFAFKTLACGIDNFLAYDLSPFSCVSHQLSTLACEVTISCVRVRDFFCVRVRKCLYCV